MADFSDFGTAARAVADPSTSSADLAAIAQLQQGLHAQVAAHPNAYPGLLDWLSAHGDPSVQAAVDARKAQGSPRFVAAGVYLPGAGTATPETPRTLPQQTPAGTMPGGNVPGGSGGAGGNAPTGPATPWTPPGPAAAGYPGAPAGPAVVPGWPYNPNTPNPYNPPNPNPYNPPDPNPYNPPNPNPYNPPNPNPYNPPAPPNPGPPNPGPPNPPGPGPVPPNPVPPNPGPPNPGPPLPQGPWPSPGGYTPSSPGFPSAPMAVVKHSKGPLAIVISLVVVVGLGVGAWFLHPWQTEGPSLSVDQFVWMLQNEPSVADSATFSQTSASDLADQVRSQNSWGGGDLSLDIFSCPSSTAFQNAAAGWEGAAVNNNTPASDIDSMGLVDTAKNMHTMMTESIKNVNGGGCEADSAVSSATVDGVLMAWAGGSASPAGGVAQYGNVIFATPFGSNIGWQQWQNEASSIKAAVDEAAKH